MAALPTMSKTDTALGWLLPYHVSQDSPYHGTGTNTDIKLGAFVARNSGMLSLLPVLVYSVRASADFKSSYRCGARWKTCVCPQFEEARLYEPPLQGAVRENAHVADRQAEYERIRAAYHAAAAARVVERRNMAAQQAPQQEPADPAAVQDDHEAEPAQRPVDVSAEPEQRQEEVVAAPRAPIVGNPRTYIPPWLRAAATAEQPAAPAACTHRSMNRVQQAARCDQCENYMRDFILSCAECQRRLCMRCRNGTNGDWPSARNR